MSDFLAYLSRRLFAAMITLLGVIAVLILIFQIIPGNPARVIAGALASQEEVLEIRRAMGLDQPVWVQYWRYLVDIVQGNLGVSPRTGAPVLTMIAARLPYTVALSTLGVLFGVIFGIPIGVWAAARKGKWPDAVGSIIGVIGISMPVFWTGILLIVLFGVIFNLLPVTGAATPASYVLPTITLGVFSMAFVVRMTRSTMLETLDQDYIRTVRGKGVREIVAVRHALHNALIPILTVVSLQYGILLGGAVLTETIFGWPGIGRLLITSIQTRDLATVQGIVLVFAAMFILVNLITDLLYTAIDPRVKLY